MADVRRADEHAQETSDTTRKLKRRGLIAGAAALVAAAFANDTQRISVGAFSTTTTYSAAANGYNGPQDAQPDGLQGYTKGANVAGVFGRNNDSNGIGVFGIAANGIGVFGQSSNGPGVSGHGDTSLGVYGESVSGQGIVGLSLSTASNPNLTQTGVTGKSLTDAGTLGWNTWTAASPPTNAVGVFGKSVSSPAIFGKSDGNVGIAGATAGGSGAVVGTAYANTSYNPAQLGSAPGVVGVTGSGSGVQGVSTSGPGLSGSSTSGVGVYGTSSANSGVYGTSTSSTGVYGSSAQSHGVYGVTNSAGFAGLYGAAGVGSSYAGYFNGPVFIAGSFTISGAKSAVVPHPDGTHRLLYCQESPEAWFEDFGEGTLAGGVATVALDADFAAVVETSALYVFVTPHVAGNALAVTARSATGFVVTEGNGGKGSGGFTYRVVAKRKDVASPRLAKVTLPPVAAALAVPTAVSAPPAPPPTQSDAIGERSGCAVACRCTWWLRSSR